MKSYDIGTKYSSQMNEKIQQYNRHINAAETFRTQNGGKPSREEAEQYLEASKIAGSIANLNLGQRNIYAQWNQRKESCESNVHQILDYINPKQEEAAPNVQPQPQPKAQSSSAPSDQQETVTVDGEPFTTKNACKDVSAETIAKWYQRKPQHTLADVIGMEDIKDMLMKKAATIGWTKLDSALGISPFQSFLFYGPPGTGKTYTIEAFASTLMEKGFKFIKLYGSDLHNSLVGVSEKIVQIAFQEAVDNEPTILFVDELDDVCADSGQGGYEKRLMDAFLQAYNMLKASGKRAIFMGATNHPGMIADAMLDRINLVYVPLPEEEMRKNFCISKLGITIDNDQCSADYMASVTDNYSFRDIERIIDTVENELKAAAIDRYGIRGADGLIDIAASDSVAAEAVSAGEFTVGMDLFEYSRRSNAPADKSEINAEIEAFEAKVNSFVE